MQAEFCRHADLFLISEHFVCVSVVPDPDEEEVPVVVACRATQTLFLTTQGTEGHLFFLKLGQLTATGAGAGVGTVTRGKQALFLRKQPEGHDAFFLMLDGQNTVGIGVGRGVGGITGAEVGGGVGGITGASVGGGVGGAGIT